MDEHEDSEKRERVLLRPWLENLIESGSIPGLEWIDEMKTMFKVPWKHRSKKTWSLRHSSIFLEWAKNTGRWSEGDPEPNYAQLKTRLRCAFNKAPDIEEMKDLHRTKTEEPYKVYKFIPRKESKLYPFGRRPLRKTTVPITIRKRRFLLSRISAFSGSSGGRLGLSDGLPLFRVKQEKDDSAIQCAESSTDGRCNGTSNNQDWMHSTWIPEQGHRLDGGESETAWSLNANNQTINRILPLIVEEENFNSSGSFDLELPPLRSGKLESNVQHSILPEISKGHREPVQSSFSDSLNNISKESVSRSVDLPMDFEPSPVSPEKLEFLPSHWQQGPSAVYDGNHGILPDTDRFLKDQSNEHSDVKQLGSVGVSRREGHRLLPAQDNQAGRLNHLSDNSMHEMIAVPSAQYHEKTISNQLGSDNRPSLVPAARRFPLKNRYQMAQNASFWENSSVSVVMGSASNERRQNAVVKPTAQPQVAVTSPYDGKSCLESEYMSKVDVEDMNRDLMSKYVEMSETGMRSPALEVIDLSTKLLNSEMKDHESKVLDLTKKMVVTPFERECPVTPSKTTSEDGGRELDEILTSDPAALSSVVSEILKFKADYKRKKQLIVTKTMLLMEKEKELKARWKQLAAREEALFWKESYLQKVMTGVDIGMIPNVAAVANRNGAKVPYIPSAEILLPAELKDAFLSVPMLSPTNASAFMPGAVPSAVTVTLPGASNFISSSTARATAFPSTIPINPFRIGKAAEQNLAAKATSSMVLPPVDHSTNNRDAGIGFDPETDVALGDAEPARMSYHAMTDKSEPNTAQPLMEVPEAPSQSVMMTRKRGRPKGSKNKVKLTAAIDNLSAVRQMPPLLVIQSPPSVNSSLGSIPSGQKPFSSQMLRNESILGSTADPYKVMNGPSATSTHSPYINRDRHPGIRASISGNIDVNRILPPVTFCSNNLPASGPKYDAATSEAAIAIPTVKVPYSHINHLPNSDPMPDTVRQLLMSASKPFSTALPPLSPPKTPDNAVPADGNNLCNGKSK